jgi:hypothetical protein
MGTQPVQDRQGVDPMSQDDDVKEINARYRAYCDACQSGQLEKVPAFWGFPVLFTVDIGKPETLHQVLSSPEELITLYSTEFGSSTGVDQTVIDSSEVVFYGEKLATIKTTLRHLAGGKLHDTQDAIYGCRKVDGEWVFVTHLSIEATK